MLWYNSWWVLSTATPAPFQLGTSFQDFRDPAAPETHVNSGYPGFWDCRVCTTKEAPWDRARLQQVLHGPRGPLPSTVQNWTEGLRGSHVYSEGQKAGKAPGTPLFI